MTLVSETNFSFPSSDGVHSIAAVRWDDTEKAAPKAVLQIIHGMSEHKELYAEFAEYMVQNGYRVYCHDQLGHGDSVNSKEERGCMPEKDPSDRLIDDIDALRKIASKENPGIPYVMLGHSMGSYLLRKYIAIYGEGVFAAVIMGTGFTTPGKGKFAVTMADVMGRLFGWTHRSILIKLLMADRYYRKFDLTGRDNTRSWLTRDIKIVDAHATDSKWQFEFACSGHKGLFETVYFDSLEKNNMKIPKTLPMLLISGSMDPVGAFGKGVIAFNNMLEQTGHDDVTVRLFPDARHELLNETNRNEIFDYIRGWLEGKL
ncbi:MAG: alpha/beta hydrolase [Eubacteriales bacterium]|nr:alpha/beta hydrolase [Eubacteriales bacterium]